MSTELTEAELAEPEPAPLQFSLAGLMLLTAVLAVGITLLKLLDIWALVVMVLMSFAAMAIPVRPARRKLRSMLLDIQWGIALPLLCFAYDPGILAHETVYASTGDMAIAIAIGQMVLLVCWKLIGPRGPFWNGLVRGGLVVGILLAGTIAILITLPAALFCVALLLGLPGLVPLMTTGVYYAAWKSTRPVEEDGKPTHQRTGILAWLLGIVTAMVLPVAYVYWGQDLGWPFRFPSVKSTLPVWFNPFIIYP